MVVCAQQEQHLPPREFAAATRSTVSLNGSIDDRSMIARSMIDRSMITRSMIDVATGERIEILPTNWKRTGCHGPVSGVPILATILCAVWSMLISVVTVVVPYYYSILLSVGRLGMDDCFGYCASCGRTLNDGLFCGDIGREPSDNVALNCLRT